MHSCSTTTHCKKFCCLHHLSYYVVMLQYLFCILFSSLCCAVIDFVTGIVRGDFFDIFCFWACNSPHYVLISCYHRYRLNTLQSYSLLHRSCSWCRRRAARCFTKTLDKRLYRYTKTRNAYILNIQNNYKYRISPRHNMQYTPMLAKRNMNNANNQCLRLAAGVAALSPRILIGLSQ